MLSGVAGTVRRLVPRELVANGLTVTNWGNSIAGTVAECTLMLILMALRRASHWALAMHREGAWKNGTTITQSLIGRRVGALRRLCRDLPAGILSRRWSGTKPSPGQVSQPGGQKRGGHQHGRTKPAFDP